MFDHPQHIIEIHRRQVLEWTREQRRGGSILAKAPKARPTIGRTIFGRLKAILRYPAAPERPNHTPALSAQE